MVVVESSAFLRECEWLEWEAWSVCVCVCQYVCVC